MGLGEGLIFTGEEIVAALEADHQIRHAAELEKKEKKKKAELKKKAMEWLELTVVSLVILYWMFLV